VTIGPGPAFLDTNVLVYIAASDPEKAARAEAVLQRGGVISVQVLNEFASVAKRKMALSWPEVRQILSVFHRLLEVRSLTADTQDLGLRLAESEGLSIYDAMIVAAALEAGCDILWSEDMQNGRLFKGVLRIANPFL
jgi:predicted nucleic acid-binding protein